jgi:hypothetical protein
MCECHAGCVQVIPKPGSYQLLLNLTPEKAQRTALNPEQTVGVVVQSKAALLLPEHACQVSHTCWSVAAQPQPGCYTSGDHAAGC